MLDALRAAGYDGVVYVPETEDGRWQHSYVDQVGWEQRYLDQADLILVWVPRDLSILPGFTTNFEMGERLSSGRLVYGRPDGAPKTQYLDRRVFLEPGGFVHQTMNSLAEETVVRLGRPHPRTDGERSVPALVWASPQFQAWYASVRDAGNRLDDARILWVFRVGPGARFLFSYALWVKVWVAQENRHKENEYVFSRTDISCVVAHRGDEVVLVREFRSPGRTRDGFVHELPGGSSFKPGRDPLVCAAEELREETGLRVDASRFRVVGERQVAATLSSHTAHVFAVELTAEEIAWARAEADASIFRGVAADSERTYIEVVTVGGIVRDRLLDWSSLGMILEALA
jgi:8-oxo-dGTP pyrophosphatase MutT (NUDIX family)